MEKLISSILRESDKFPDEVSNESESQEEGIVEYKPTLISGVVQNPHICSNEEL